MANIDTKKRLLLAGYVLAKEIGVSKLTFANVAERAACSRNTIMRWYGSVAQFRAAVLAYGIEQGTMRNEDVGKPMRLSPEDRKASILAEAYRQAVATGLGNVTRLSVAQPLAITDGLINRYFDGVDGLRAAVLEQAVQAHTVDVVADAIELAMPLHGVPPGLLAEARALIAP